MRALGTGRLNWLRDERVTDRYGSVHLDKVKPETDGLIGKSGMLIARVIETRKSQHVGDLFRHVFPTTPTVGEEIILGTGKLFVFQTEGNYQIGVEPLDGRTSDWMDIKALYRVHDQTVILYFSVEQ